MQIEPKIGIFVLNYNFVFSVVGIKPQQKVYKSHISFVLFSFSPQNYDDVKHIRLDKQ